MNVAVRLKPEMFWRPDPAIDAARRQPGWYAFHRACGRLGVYFDHPGRSARGGVYEVLCFTVRGDRQYELARGHGPTPVAALADAHDRSGRGTSETLTALMEVMGL